MSLTYRQWMSEVDAALVSVCGLTHHDLADQCWRDWYEDEVSPAEAARDALADEGFPVECLDGDD